MSAVTESLSAVRVQCQNAGADCLNGHSRSNSRPCLECNGRGYVERQMDQRERLQHDEANRVWSAIEASPKTFAQDGSMFDEFDFTEEQRATLIAAAVAWKTNGTLRAWYVQAAMIAILSAVTKKIDDHAFGVALEAS